MQKQEAVQVDKEKRGKILIGFPLGMRPCSAQKRSRFRALGSGYGVRPGRKRHARSAWLIGKRAFLWHKRRSLKKADPVKNAMLVLIKSIDSRDMEIYPGVCSYFTMRQYFGLKTHLLR